MLSSFTQPLMAADLLGRRIVQYVQGIAELTWFTITGVFRRPFYTREYVNQLNDIGVSSLPVIVTTGLVTGMVLALQSHISLAQFGATWLLGNAITATIVRELGPLLAALMIAGRVGAGITSHIGSMKVTSQIDALLALGTDPVKKLVVPRIVALTFTLPLLVIIISFLGIVGGWLLARFTLQFPTHYYFTSVVENLRFIDIGSGLVKAAVFGFIIAVIGCHEGLRTRGGTHGVGTSTTRAVVMASLCILVANFFLSKFFYTIVYTQ